VGKTEIKFPALQKNQSSCLSPQVLYLSVLQQGVHSRSDKMASAAASKPQFAEPPTVIHNHFEMQRAGASVGSVASFDPTGPALGSVYRNEEGDITHATGVNMLLGYSWKNYFTPSKPLSWYTTFGTLCAFVPHFEVGIDYRMAM